MWFTEKPPRAKPHVPRARVVSVTPAPRLPAPGMHTSVAAAAQKPRELTALRAAPTPTRPRVMSQSPAQPPALLVANMVR